MTIRKYSDLAKEAFQNIKKYQVGEKTPIYTGLPYYDEVFPPLTGDVLVFTSPSGVGKTFILAQIKENILDEKVNPNASKFVMLDFSLEMRVTSLILRGISKHLKKDKKNVLLEKFTEEERVKANEYAKLIEDDRVYISQEPTTPNKFFELCTDFLETNKDKEAVIISLDHTALLGADGGDSRNSSIEKLAERINDLKLKYDNVLFILLSQMNSDINRRANEKDRKSQPQDSDLYYSNFIFQIASHVACMVNPSKLGIKSYSKLYKDRYEHLSPYFEEEDAKGRISLTTNGVNYVHLLKCRESSSNMKDIFAHDLGYKKQTFNTPKYTNTAIQVPDFDEGDYTKIDMSMLGDNFVN